MRAAVIGAGVSGLTAAYRLGRAGYKVTVFESQPRVGGLARSATVAGNVIDRYFHFICPPDAAYLELVDELGLTDSLRWRQTRMGVFRDGSYHSFGTPGALAAFTPLPAPDRARFALAVLRARRRRDWRDLDDLSAREWLVAEQGSRCYDTIWRPLLELKFGDAAEEISAAWMWARINRVALSRRGPLMRERLGYLDGGTSPLIDALVDRVADFGGEIALSARVDRIVVEGGRVSGLEIAGDSHHFDAVVSTVAPGLLAGMVDLPFPGAGGPDSPRYLGVSCRVILAGVSLCDDFWLNVDDPAIPYPGVITYTNLDAMPQFGGAHLHYLPHYRAHSDPAVTGADDRVAQLGGDDDAELPQLLEALDRIRPGFSKSVIESHVFEDTYAQPIYGVGYMRRFSETFRSETPVTGLYRADMSQVYPNDRSLVNAVDYATRAARAAIQHLSAGGEVRA